MHACWAYMCAFACMNVSLDILACACGFMQMYYSLFAENYVCLLTNSGKYINFVDTAIVSTLIGLCFWHLFLIVYMCLCTCV